MRMQRLSPEREQAVIAEVQRWQDLPPPRRYDGVIDPVKWRTAKEIVRGMGADLDAPWPLATIRATKQPWTALWPRPTAATWPGDRAQLAAAQAEWDAADDETLAFYRWSNEQRAAREAAEAAKTQARVEAELDALKAQLRQRFLALPGATPEEFETEWPTLLADHRRAALREEDREAAQAAAKYRAMF